jgi:Transcriptional Coactivator p15 (PC4)
MTGGLPILIGTLAMGSKAEVRVSLDSFQGRPRVDLRTWCDFSVGPVATRGPTKKGVSLPIADLPALLATIRDAEAKARSLGLLAKGGMDGT